MKDTTALWDEAAASAVVPLRLRLLPEDVIVEVSRRDMIVGRHSQADVRLTHPDVSRRHCRLVYQDGLWRVQDLGSLNGVYLNEQRIQDAVVYAGDRLRMGGHVLLVDQAAAPASPQCEVLRSIVEAIPSGRGWRQAS